MSTLPRWTSLIWIALVGWGAEGAGAFVSERPSEVRAEYKITKAGIVIGTVEEVFSREGDRYRIVSDTRTSGPLRIFLKDRLTVTSEGRIADGGLLPDRYEFRRERDKGKNLSAEFDWTGRRIVSRHGDITEEFALPAGTKDRISAMYQFMFSAPAGDRVTTWMSQGKKAEQYRYRLQGEDRLALAGRSLDALHFAREAGTGESRAELWLAKDLHFLPVKMVFEDNHGLSLEQTLVSLSLR